MTDESFERQLHPSQDERYTVAYIQREAVLLLRYLKRGKHHVFCDLQVSHTPLDLRIMRAWGIR